MTRWDPARAIDDILDREKDAILNGRFDRLDRLLRDKGKVVEWVGQIRDPSAVRRIRAKADRNQALLMAAGEGLRSAMARLAELRTGVSDLSTYAEDGARSPMAARPSSLERRR